MTNDKRKNPEGRASPEVAQVAEMRRWRVNQIFWQSAQAAESFHPGVVREADTAPAPQPEPKVTDLNTYRHNIGTTGVSIAAAEREYTSGLDANAIREVIEREAA